MPWKVIAFETSRGEKPVKEFIKSLDEPTIAKVTHEIDLLKIHGPILGMPRSKKLTSDLYELRIRGREEARIIYCMLLRKKAKNSP